MKTNKDFYQHGDVLFKRVKEIPKAELKRIKGNVIMEGEATGHAHTAHPIVSPGVKAVTAKVFQIWANAKTKQMYFETKEDVQIDHQEHEQFDLPPGNWHIGNVREKDHFNDAVQRVLD